jgi:hypothetical protein
MDKTTLVTWMTTSHDSLNNIAALASIITATFSLILTLFLIIFFFRDKEKYLSGRWEGKIDNLVGDDKTLNLDCVINFTKHKNLPVQGMLYYSCKSNDNDAIEGLDELDNSHTIEKFKFDEEFKLKFTRKIHVQGGKISTDTQRKYNWNITVKKASVFLNFNRKYTMDIEIGVENESLNSIHFKGKMHKVL